MGCWEDAAVCRQSLWWGDEGSPPLNASMALGAIWKDLFVKDSECCPEVHSESSSSVVTEGAKDSECCPEVHSESSSTVVLSQREHLSAQRICVGGRRCPPLNASMAFDAIRNDL